MYDSVISRVWSTQNILNARGNLRRHDDPDEVIVRGPGGAHRPATGGQEAPGVAGEGIAPGGTQAVGSAVDDARRCPFFSMVAAERATLLESVSPSSSDDDDTDATDASTSAPRVAVMVRKRPLFERETTRGKQVDVVTALPMGRLAVHEPKTSVDCSKRVESSVFEFDDLFGEDATNDDVYVRAVAPLVRLCISGAEEGANATCFAYGQTGSGKTHTMSACYEQTARDLAAGCETNGLSMRVSFYDIYGGKCYDLLSDRAPCQALEDARGRTKIVGLREVTALDASEVLSLVERGMRCRKTSRTDGNATSSRSHAVFQVTLKSKLPGEEGVKRMPPRLALVDLAGSERGADRGKLVDQRIRREGAEINKSLLALKECIRALSVGCGVNGGKDGGALAAEPSFVGEQRVPFRGSKLTQVLRDAFIGKNSKTVLLAHVSPGHGHAEHTLNTLRYAIRLKDGSDGSTPPVGPKPASPRARPHSPGSPLFRRGPDVVSVVRRQRRRNGRGRDADGWRTPLLLVAVPAVDRSRASQGGDGCARRRRGGCGSRGRGSLRRGTSSSPTSPRRSVLCCPTRRHARRG